MKRWSALLALLMAVPATAIGQQMEQVSDEMEGGSHGELHAVIEQASTEWVEAFNAGDVDALMAMYAEGAHSLAPNVPVAKGRDAIRSNLESWFADGAPVEMSSEVWEVHEAGDKVIEIGGYTVTGPDGEHLDHGKYLNVLASVDGEWKVLREIWNSSMAPPSADAVHEEMHDRMHGADEHEGDMEYGEEDEDDDR